MPYRADTREIRPPQRRQVNARKREFFLCLAKDILKNRLKIFSRQFSFKRLANPTTF